MKLVNLYAKESLFQHIAGTARPLFEIIDDVMQAPIQLRKTGAPAGRDFHQFRFNSKGYTGGQGAELDKVLADECILMGTINGCFDVRKVCFRGSVGGECAKYLEVKTGDAALDADGIEMPIDDCVLDVDEKAAAWPKSDVFLVRVDAATVNSATGKIAGIPIALEAEGIMVSDELSARTLGTTPGGSCWAVIVKPSADVPDLASLVLEVEIANPAAL